MAAIAAATEKFGKLFPFPASKVTQQLALEATRRAETQHEPAISELTPQQLDKLVRDGITIITNLDGTHILKIHILIALTDEQLEAINKAVNDYIDDYEGLLERIIEALAGKDDFKCLAGSCEGKAQLPAAAQQIAETGIEEVVINSLEKYTLYEEQTASQKTQPQQRVLFGEDHVATVGKIEGSMSSGK